MVNTDTNLFKRIWELIYSDKVEQRTMKPDEKEIINRIYDLSRIEEPDYDALCERTVSRMRYKKIRTSLRYAAVIVPIMIMGAVALFLFQRPETDTPISGNAIVLTLSDGSVINLEEQKWDDAASDELLLIADGNDSGITYADSGSEDAEGVYPNGEMIFHTLDIPPTKIYRLILADGTVVRLNSGTRLRYPAVFGKSERRVSLLCGEACFEVAKEKNRGFFVESNGHVIEALGTVFNVKAYPELMGTVKTTLVQGLVSVSNGMDKVLLSPGQQASGTAEGTITVTAIEPGADIAWTQGRYIFRNRPLGEILTQMGRWYGFDVSFEKAEIENLTFTGIIEKDSPPQEALDLFEKMADIRFEFKGTDNIIVRIK